ncbi:MAG TPA: adenylate/guanylate cyclase domain-containing protein [Anaerolineales bacterium]|jgi:predicted ATPase/class 3 adenylate cyclase|nr:adenylate/guanylate cyclase domain-containing protein [Anaerolineales bacterium]
MSKLPTGTVTFLFTDIEGSTQLWEKHPEAMKEALAQHDALLREAIEANGGQVIKTTGDGMHSVFEKAIDTVHAALAAQRALKDPVCGLPLRVRMGLHTGEAELRASDYYGQALNRAARIMACGHGGQVLLSSVTAELAREHLPVEVSLLDLGEHRLRDLVRPEHLFQILAPGLQSEFPALKTRNAFPNNLPPPLTSFIGRERELQEAKRLLASARLLTLIGPGGTGKTRLSLQLATDQVSEFKDGAWLVELAALSDPAFILSAIASVLELHEVSGVPLLSIVIDYLRAKQLLLVLDNCEHLVEASAQIADQILHACPQLKIIASSREALGIDGETVYRVPSLSLPDSTSQPLMEYESTRLFIDRAAKAEPRFHLTDQNAASIVQICQRLDGIPLAIELAAARVKLFTPEQIAERLDDRFKLLTGGSRTALPRQQTLRALIDWSYQSLNEAEQRALRRLSVCSGGWTFEAAEAVAGESDAMDGLLGLVNKSLVNVEEQDGESRYRFLETIRQYAMEKLLESGEAIEIRDRHLDFFLHSMKQAPQREQKIFGALPDDTEWLDRMEREHGNVRAALEWSASNHPEKALRLVYTVGNFWVARDYNLEARRWCQAVLERGNLLPGMEEERAKVYGVLGWSSIGIGDHKTGRDAAETGIALARKVNDAQTIGRLLGLVTLACIFLGDFPAAEQALAEAEVLAREHGFVEQLATVLTTRAQLAFSGYRDIAQAKAYLEEALSLAPTIQNQWAMAMSLFGMGRVAGIMGDLNTARTKFLESAGLANKMGNKRQMYSCYSELAHVLRENGEVDEPLSIYRDLLPKWRDLGHRAAVAHELECIAYILSKKDQTRRAVTLLGAADQLRKLIASTATPIELAEYEKELSALREKIAADEFRKAWEQGQGLTMEEAIALAVENANPNQNYKLAL